jgi:Xaa-Pro aminopeptidase
MKTGSHLERLSALRDEMRRRKYDGLFVPRTDEFQGEYVPTSAERLSWLTGFSGSWGMAVIGQKRAALIVDGRYTIQAAKETKALPIELLSPEPERLASFLAGFKKGAILAFDPWVTSVAEARRLNTLVSAARLKLVPANANLVDAVWTDRPAAPSAAVYHHPKTYAGQSSIDKLALIAQLLKAKRCDGVVLTDPHSVAWALNIRGGDVAHTPLALLRALVFKNGTARLFVDRSRCSKAVTDAFGKHVTCESAEALQSSLMALGKKKQTVLIDPGICPEAVRVMLQRAKVRIIEDQDPCVLPRACKNITEQNGARLAQVRDGAALSNFLAWLDLRATEGDLAEIPAAEKLESYRRATGKLEDLSFGSISASGPNAALPHYHAVGKTGRKLGINEIYLIDSGGQYRDGTTDVTRTVIIGTPTTDMKRHNTLVLKGMIAVSLARFPAGTTGIQLDSMARAALWQHGFDFDHGTGHGVGSFLSVHEGPARISKAGHVALQPGMIVSNEPGYYRKDHYGIRIENLLLVKPATKPKGGDRSMLSFETLTFAPIDAHLIEDDMLTKAEIHWLDQYHEEVLRKLGSLVNEETKPWLTQACAPLRGRS